jgi:hypothetical protein
MRAPGRLAAAGCLACLAVLCLGVTGAAAAEAADPGAVVVADAAAREST